VTYIKGMRDKDGVITSLRVRWRAGASRDGEGRSERFGADEEGRAAAQLSCAAVNDCGQERPPGCVEGPAGWGRVEGDGRAYLVRTGRRRCR